MTAGCAACGSCCDPVVIEADVFFSCGKRARSQDAASDDDRFITQHWHPLYGWQDEADGTWVLAVRCGMFDPASRLCAAHETRPPVCRDFPWYGREPSLQAGLLPHCSYLADLPPAQRRPGDRPLIPLTVISPREAA